jgi:hypothetical protein
MANEWAYYRENEEWDVGDWIDLIDVEIEKLGNWNGWT